MVIFNKKLKRLDLLSIKPNDNNRKIKIAIYRNHSFEMVASVLNSFLDFSNLKAEFLYSDYDDSLNFTQIVEYADLNIIWLDLSRYKNIDIRAWVLNRILALKKLTDKKIIVYHTGEVDLSNINETDVIIADSNNIKEELKDLFLDLKKQEYSGTKYSNKSCLYIARELGLIYIPSCFLPSLKAIILDLDNTLYKGVLGEDGINGIEPHFELLKYLKHLKGKGMLLAVVSKNEKEDVINFLKSRKDLILNLDDFSVIQANWNSKAENINNILKYLNIGVDSVIFIDDNIGELETVKFYYPQIKIIEATSEDNTLNVLKYYPGVYKTNFSIEDSIRTKDLKANRERETLLKELDEDDYFKKLQISLCYDLSPKAHLQRVTELLNKTNQFIFNYARYSATEIEQIFDEKNSCIITVSMSDRLSDSGIIAILVAHNDSNCSIIDELVVSCRALGRNIENILLGNLFKILNKKFDTNVIKLKYKKGERNKPALEWMKKYTNLQDIKDNGNVEIVPNIELKNKYITVNIINTKEAHFEKI